MYKILGIKFVVVYQFHFTKALGIAHFCVKNKIISNLNNLNFNINDGLCVPFANCMINCMEI